MSEEVVWQEPEARKRKGSPAFHINEATIEHLYNSQALSDRSYLGRYWEDHEEPLSLTGRSLEPRPGRATILDVNRLLLIKAIFDAKPLHPGSWEAWQTHIEAGEEPCWECKVFQWSVWEGKDLYVCVRRVM